MIHYVQFWISAGGFLRFKMEVEDLYPDFILELYRHPLNKGKLLDADVTFRDVNPFCGDAVEISLKISDGKIIDIRFLGEGCAISHAAASLLTELVKGKKVEEILQMNVDNLLQEMSLPQLKENPARIKCAALPLKVVKVALYKYLGKKEEVAWKDVV